MQRKCICKTEKNAGLDEIRFSYKIEDEKKQKEKVLFNMELAKSFIPAVMAEMPVMPDAEEEMKHLLHRLDDMDIFGINLKDYYLKTIKAFGDDAVRVCGILKKAGITNYVYDKRKQFIQFHPDNAYLLDGLGIELAVSVNVMEQQNGATVSRELKLLQAAAEDCRRENL